MAKGLEHGLCSSTNTAHSSSEGVDDKEKALELDWFEYWDTQGYKLVFESWIEKYKEFINPTYQELCKDGTKYSFENIPLGNSPSTEDCQWTQLWEEHLQEKYFYYQNWFSQWWTEKESQSQISVNADEESSSDIEEKNLTEHINPIPAKEFENLSLCVNPEMEGDSWNSSFIHTREINHSEKTILEKTREFLGGLGFTSNLSNSDSNINSCRVLAMKKKKKNKKKRVC